jgi:hypothetical protein
MAHDKPVVGHMLSLSLTRRGILFSIRYSAWLNSLFVTRTLNLLVEIDTSCFFINAGQRSAFVFETAESCLRSEQV